MAYKYFPHTEEDIRAIIAGTKQFVQRRHRDILAPEKNSLVIDIEAKLSEGKGGGYERWAKVHNLKQMAQTINYLREQGLLDLNELQKRILCLNVHFIRRAENIYLASCFIRDNVGIIFNFTHKCDFEHLFALRRRVSGYNVGMISALSLNTVRTFAARFCIALTNKCFGEKERKLLTQSLTAASKHYSMRQTPVLY